MNGRRKRLFGFGLLVGWAVGGLAAEQVPPARDPVRGRTLFREALAAREASDLPAYRAKLEQALIALPDPSNLWFRLAGARVLAGERPPAFEALEAQLAAGMHRPDFETNPDLAPLHEHLRWKPLAEANARLVEPLARSGVAFVLPSGGQLVEGVALDAASGSWFFSVVNERTILRRTANGTVTVFASLAGSLPGSPLGLALDGERRRLWTVTAGLPHGAGLPDAERNRSALAAFDLKAGAPNSAAPLLRVDAPEGALLNDLVLAADGTVYASDPGRGTVVRLRAGATALEDLVPPGALVSPGGLALAAGGGRLFVADWGYGLAAIDLAPSALAPSDLPAPGSAAATFRWLAPPPSGTTLGIDGLLRDGDSLLAIQNGVMPPRITRFTLSADGLALAQADLLERAVPGWDEPTLGVLSGSDLLYVATSHWPKFGEDGKPADPALLSPTEIRRLPLR